MKLRLLILWFFVVFAVSQHRLPSSFDNVESWQLMQVFYRHLADMPLTLEPCELEEPPAYCPVYRRAVLKSAHSLRHRQAATIADFLNFSQTYSEDPPLHASAHFYAGDVYYYKRQWAEAIRYFERLNPRFLPYDLLPEYYFKMGYAYFKLKNFGSAWQWFYLIYEKFPANKEYYPLATFYLGYIAYLQGKYKEALYYFSELNNDRRLSKYVPFYIAQIKFIEGYKQRDFSEFIAYARPLANRKGIHHLFRRETNRLLAYAYLLNNKPDSGLVYLREYVKYLKQMAPYEALIAGFLAYKAGKCQEAEEYLGPVTEKSDTIAQYASYYIGQCYISSGEPGKALIWLRKAQQGQSKQIAKDASYDLLQALIHMKQYNEAIKVLAYYLDSLNPNYQELKQLKQLLPMILLHTGDYPRAIALLEQIKAGNPELERIYEQVAFNYAMQLINDGKHKEASTLLNNLVQSSNLRLKALAYYWLGELAYAQNNYSLARDYWTNFLQLAKLIKDTLSFPATRANAHYNIAYTYYDREDLLGAQSHFEQSVSLFRKRILGSDEQKVLRDAWLRLGDVLLLQKKWKQALKVFEDYVREGPPPKDYALLQYGIIAGKEDMPEKKYSALTRLLDEYPQSPYAPEAAYQLGKDAFDMGNYSLAKQFFKKVLKYPSHRRYPSALAHLGLIYYHLGNYDSSLHHMEQLLLNFPSSPEAQPALAIVKDIYFHWNNPEGYIAFLEKIPGKGKMDTTSKEALLFEQAEWLVSEDRCDQAVDALDRYLQQFPDGRYYLTAHFYRAECLRKLGKYDKALNDYELLISRKPNPYYALSLINGADASLAIGDSLRAFHFLIEALSVAADEEKYMQLLRKAVEIAPVSESPDSSILVARTLFVNPFATSDDKVNASYVLARAFMHKGELDSAMHYYQIVANSTDMEPGIEARYMIAEILFRKGELEKAYDKAFELINHVPASDYWIAKSFILLGRIFAEQGNIPQAKATLQSIIDNYPGEDLKQEARKYLEQIEQQEQQNIEQETEIPIDEG